MYRLNTGNYLFWSYTRLDIPSLYCLDMAVIVTSLLMPYKSHNDYIRTELEHNEYLNGERFNHLVSPTEVREMLNERSTEFQTPGWRARIKRGEDATTVMSGVRWHAWYQPGYTTYEWEYKPEIYPAFAGDVFVEEGIGRLAPLENIPPIGVDPVQTLIDVDQQALIRFISDCRSAQSRLKGQVVLGELGEALHMLRNPAKSLRNGINSYVGSARRLLKGNRLTGASKRARKRALRDTWLEYSFGWSPFINDIKDAKTALEDVVELRTSQFCSGSAKESLLSAEANNLSTIQFYNDLRCFYDRRDVYEITSRYYGRVRLKSISPEGPRLISQTFGFSWQEFVPTIWELIPYSFLVDYFTNIGDIIEVLTFQESELLWKSRTNRVALKRSVEGFRRDPLPLEGGSYWNTLGYITIPPVQRDEYKTIERLRITWPLVADFRFKIPGLGLKWLNIAALANLRKLNP
jgi:hypothetical protein